MFSFRPRRSRVEAAVAAACKRATDQRSALSELLIFALSNLYAFTAVCVPASHKCEDPSTPLRMTDFFCTLPWNAQMTNCPGGASPSPTIDTGKPALPSTIRMRSSTASARNALSPGIARSSTIRMRWMIARAGNVLSPGIARSSHTLNGVRSPPGFVTHWLAALPPRALPAFWTLHNLLCMIY